MVSAASRRRRRPAGSDATQAMFRGGDVVRSALRALGIAGVIAAGACAGAPAPRPSAPPRIRISTGARGGAFYAMGAALLRTAQQASTDVALENLETAGSVANLVAIQDGSTDCAFSYSDVAYEAMAGRLPDQAQSFDRLRGVALVQLSPLYFLVAKRSPIRTVGDLRHKTVALRSRESGSLQAAMLVLEAYGLDVGSLDIRSESFPGAFARLVNGSVDGVMILTGQPSDLVSQAVRSNARILPIAGPPVDDLRERYPFLRPALILGGIYPDHEAPIRTIGIESLLLCRDSVSAAQVTQVTRAWFLAARRLSDIGEMSDPISPDLAAATPIPLHDGAKRYYRERQLLP